MPAETDTPARTKPTQMRLTPDELRLADEIAAHLHAQTGVSMTRTDAVRHALAHTHRETVGKKDRKKSS